MSTVLSSRELCNRVLRKIGAFPITESAADGELVQETLYWLDLALAELPGTARRFWMVSDTVSFPLTSGVQSYDLKEKLGDSWPEEGLEHVVEAWLQNSTGSRLPLEIVRRLAAQRRHRLGHHRYRRRTRVRRGRAHRGADAPRRP